MPHFVVYDLLYSTFTVIIVGAVQVRVRRIPSSYFGKLQLLIVYQTMNANLRLRFGGARIRIKPLMGVVNKIPKRVVEAGKIKRGCRR